MYLSKSLRLSFIISLGWHVLCFSSIEFTFGHKPFNNNYAKVIFLGSILEGTDFLHYSLQNNIFPKTVSLKAITEPKEDNKQIRFNFNKALKPDMTINLVKEEVFFDSSNQVFSQAAPYFNKNKEQVVIYQPNLPKFLFWFRERPPADIELSFFVSSQGKAIFIERTVSTGSLEADLLAMYYLKRWIFFQSGLYNTTTASHKIRLNLK